MKSTSWLNKVLQNREKRVEKQKELMAKYSSVVLSLTINIPGRDKTSNDARYIYETALKEIEKLNLQVYEKLSTRRDTGYESLWALKEEASYVKSITCEIEESHPLGRFMDIDVLDRDGQILSRSNPRRCFLCENSASLCAREQKHSIIELLEHISKSVDDCRHSL